MTTFLSSASLNSDSLCARSDTPDPGKPVRVKVEIEVDGGSVSYLEWQALAALGLDADFEALIAFHYSGKPLPFALRRPGLAALRS